jgi:hypothetical protein
MKAIDHGLGVRQQLPASVVEGRGHVGSIRLHPLPLRFAQLFQAFSGSSLVPSFRHGQHLGPLGVGQVRQNGGVQLVSLLQTQLIDAHVGKHPLRIDVLGLGVGPLVADDQSDRLGGDAQAPGNFLLVTADQQAQHLLFKAVGIAGVLAFKGRDQVLAMVAPGTAMIGGSVDPEAGLTPEV